MKKLLLFLLGVAALPLHAQSPGGVNGADLWYKAVPATSNLQGLYRWQDFSGDSVALTLRGLSSQGNTEFTQSRALLHTFNFHPAFSLSEGLFGKVARMKYSNLSQATVIGVFAFLPDTEGTDMLLYGMGGREGAGTVFTKDKAVRVQGTEPLDYGSETGEDLLYASTDSLPADGFRETSPRIATYLKADRPSFSVWGEASDAAISFGTTYSAANPDFGTMFDESAFGNEEFDGYTPEFIVYSRYLTPLERRRAESYLAVKYGITLDGSYLDSDGNLLWDRDEAPAYHNRVAAYGNDAAGGLEQPMSATSYEEAPNFSALKENDSYHRSNSYNLPSSARLLVMGREYGNAMPDKGYVFWGDDDAPTATYTSPADTLWHIMNRTWLVKTNVQSTADSLVTRWTGNGLEVSRDGFLDDITQETATAGAFAVTPAMPKNAGYIEFQCPTSHPTFDVGFAESGGSECAYGFRFGNDGSVRTISGGQVSNRAVASDVSGSTVSLQRQEGNLFLRIDGAGSADYTIAMLDTVASYNGVVRTETAEEPLALHSVRTGGIGDTGSQAELSYGLTASREFEDYCRKRTVMLIDPTGEGEFDTDNMTMIRCSKPDIARGKTMFHNIFWDVDGSGSDVFTFAYYDGLSVEAKPTPSTCEDGAPKNDGSIEIGIDIGTPVYNYVLSVDTVAGKEHGETIASGTFIGDTHRIDRLAPGTYTLTVTQGGGNDIYGTGNPLYTVYSHDTRSYLSGEITWTIAETNSNYRVGLEPSLSDEITQYGFDVRGDRAHIIYDGYTSATQYVTVKEGDVLSVSVGNMQVVYRVNGEVFHREVIWSIRAWRFCIKYGTGETHITNLTVNGEPVESFTTEGSVQIETPKQNTVQLTVHVGSECDETMPNGTEEKKERLAEASHDMEPAEQSEFSVNGTGEATRIFNAALERNVESDAILTVFDVSGKLLVQKEMQGGTRKAADFNVPGAGVYIVKALTSDDKEYTKKIIAK